ncbi:MAG TPA: hypothetical protein VKX34_06050 [Aequorivita sp.]|nr:hypothetical protein [Aequorivita sp.]
MRQLILLLTISAFFASCEYFTNAPEEVVVARVNDNYLYLSDVEKLISENTSPEDSLLIVNNYITRWATQQLLIDQAKINLTSENLERFDRLVEEYKNDLLTDAYKNVVVGRQMDSVVSKQEFQTYYQKHKENFKLNDVLLKMRYIQLPVNNTNSEEIKEKFTRFNAKDKEALSDQSFVFVSSNLNDSVWIKKDKLLENLPILRGENEQVLKKSNFVQLKDSLGVYLVKIEDILGLNETAPISYIKPTLKQIILNKRKLELIKKFETDITRDAIENNKFEIYTYE